MVDLVESWGLVESSERDLFIENLLVRIHVIIVMIRWTGLAPWEFESPFPGSLTSTGGEQVHAGARAGRIARRGASDRPRRRPSRAYPPPENVYHISSDRFAENSHHISSDRSLWPALERDGYSLKAFGYLYLHPRPDSGFGLLRCFLSAKRMPPSLSRSKGS